MKKLLLIMMPLLAIACSAWADNEVKIGGYVLSNGGTFTNSNNSRIDSGSASLSSDGMTLTLDNMVLTTKNADGIEVTRNNLTIVVVGYCMMVLDGKYGIVVGAKNVTIKGGERFDIIAQNSTSIIMKEGSSLTISNVGELNISHKEKRNSWGIAGKGTNNFGDVTIISSVIDFAYCKENCFGDLNSVNIYSAGSRVKMNGNGSEPNINNVKSMTLGNGICFDPDGTYFSSSQKTVVDASGQPIKNYMEILFKYVVKIDEEHFPDQTFRNFIRNNQTINTDLDDYLTQEEIDLTKNIDVANKNIANLKGIEYFTELTSLNCNQTNIAALNVTNNTKLTNLSCAFCMNLTSLNVNNCNALESLNVMNTKLTALDLSGRSKLKTLSCANCSDLATLNVKNCTSLQTLEVPGMYGYELNSIDVSGCTALKTLDCHGNSKLATLNFSNCTALTNLNCSECSLTEINAENCPKLTSLSYSKEKVTKLTLNKTGLTQLIHNNGSLTSLTCMNNPDLKTLDCSHNNIYNTSISNCPALETIDLSYNSVFPLVITALNALKSLNVSNSKLSSLSISSCSNLESVNCDNTDGLTTVIITVCPALTELTLTSLASLILTVTGLEEFVYDESALTYKRSKKVIISGNNKLKTLKWNNSGLEELTLSSNPLLKTIDVSNNKLKALTLDACNDEAVVYCQNNLLKDTNVDSFVESLPDKSGMTPAIYYLDKTSDTEKNTCTMEQLAVATAKGWKFFYYNGQNWLPFLGSDYIPTAIESPESPMVETGDAPIFNLQGQRVGDNYKGIVIVNGKKVRRK